MTEKVEETLLQWGFHSLPPRAHLVDYVHLTRGWYYHALRDTPTVEQYEQFTEDCFILAHALSKFHDRFFIISDVRPTPAQSKDVILAHKRFAQKMAERFPVRILRVIPKWKITNYMIQLGALEDQRYPEKAGQVHSLEEALNLLDRLTINPLACGGNAHEGRRERYPDDYCGKGPGVLCANCGNPRAACAC